MDLDRFTRRAERLLALAALHGVAEPLVGEPVFLATRGALDDDAAIIQLNGSCHGFLGLLAAGLLF